MTRRKMTLEEAYDILELLRELIHVLELDARDDDGDDDDGGD